MTTIITTINPPNQATKDWEKTLKAQGGKLIVVGDKKTPSEWEGQENFFSLQSQREGSSLGRLLPENCYSRKNMGYLLAMVRDTPCIHDTDDDNFPLSEWKPRSKEVRGAFVSPQRWTNIYRLWKTDRPQTLLWPRGFPIEEIQSPAPQTKGTAKLVSCPLQQGLAQNHPDVDALWRLTSPDEISFQSRSDVILSPGNWCPINSQNTWWWPEVFPLLYLPTYCSMRATDIWRGFVAQRCLQQSKTPTCFFSPDVRQARNPHDLTHDLREEMEIYTLTKKLRDGLESLSLTRFHPDNLLLCYEMLVKLRIFPKKELKLVEAWNANVKTCTS